MSVLGADSAAVYVIIYPSLYPSDTLHNYTSDTTGRPQVPANARTLRERKPSITGNVKLNALLRYRFEHRLRIQYLDV